MGKEKLRSLFREISGTSQIFDQIQSVEVVSVDFPFFTGELRNGSTIENIRLVSEESDANIYVLPKVGSNVIVGFVDNNNGVLLVAGELDEVIIRGDQYGGLVKVSDLVTKLNNLENKVNTIINTFNTHVHAGVTVGAGATAVTPTLVVGTLTPTTVNDLENALVKHG